jgi:hypothetical protein
MPQYRQVVIEGGVADTGLTLSA